jgi:hypothetical protein
MPEASKVNENIQPLWQMVSLTDYALPTAPTREAAVKGITALWRLIRGKDSKQVSFEKTEDQLRTFSDTQLSRIAPAIDWHKGAESLDVKLRDWLEQKKQNPPILFLIGPPYSGHSDILRLWAKMHGVSIIEAPAPEQILAQDKNWFSDRPDNERLWVLPSLEYCYLRHADGLAVVRRFFERALSGRLGFGLIGCDSWAWAFFQKLWSFPQPQAITVQAFDSERLKVYFSELTLSTVIGPLRFRDSRSGGDILPARDTEKEANSSTSPFLKQLAELSRGNIGIAWIYWRNSLCAEPDETPESDSSETGNHIAPKNTIWLRAGLKELAIPAGSNQDMAFVLHCLLLHNSLPVDLLVELLPLTRGVVTSTLILLESAHLVEEKNNAWRVSASGYPAVRQFLKSNDYMVDQF